MSKIKSADKRKHNTDGLVLVKSRTYGEHYRAARGTKKTAILNVSLSAQAEKTSVINKAAKAVYDALIFYSEGFREGQLWQAMLSRMRKANNISFENLLLSLKRLELNSRYPIKRFGNIPLFTVDNKKKVLNVQMKLFMPPHLNNGNCYQYTLVVLMLNSKGVCLQHSVATTEWINKNEKLNTFDFSFEKPARAKYFLFCLELKGGVNGVATNTLASRGIVIV